MITALTIAGSDSVGGAGIQADLKAFASLGVHGASVITCVTSQNTQEVRGIFPLPVEFIEEQLEAVIVDLDVTGVKTGMLYSGRIASSVFARLSEVASPIVVDPVLVAGMGNSLHTQDLLEVMKTDVIPAATIITPNRYEAETIVGFPISSFEERQKACEMMARMGADSVLLKGGHFEGEQAVDLLYSEGEFTTYRSPRVGATGHGGGCTLSSYLAALLAKGMVIKQAVEEAKQRIWEAFITGYSVGKGARIVNAIAPLDMKAERYDVISSLSRAVEELEFFLGGEWVPEVGINFVYALPSALYPSEVCGVEGRLSNVRGAVHHMGCMDFGASEHVANIVITAMHFDRTVRSALNLRFSEENLRNLMNSGLSVGSFDRSQEPEEAKTMEWGTAHATGEMGTVPDAIFDRGGVGKEPMIRILGKDPEDVLRKVRIITGEADRR
jgi:hydroxymethylpyrimidine kinase / phosphomethylpyrimidine kinase / thiamine-phosphate diphosphorylase